LISKLLGGFIETFRAFRIVNSEIEELIASLDMLADRGTLEMICDIAFLQCMFLLLNLALFLELQIAFTIPMIAACMEIFH